MTPNARMRRAVQRAAASAMASAVPAAAVSSAAATASAPSALPSVLRLPLFDDLHLHLRDGATAASLLADLPATVARALVMPNLKPPVVNAADVAAYGARLAGWLPAGSRFKPLMSLYLTDRTDAASARARVARLP
jgi:hypothetical protein